MSTNDRESVIWQCYICNLDVPTSHIQDHSDSWEHEANMSICQESLKRLNKYIEIKNYTGDSKKMDDNNYFCYICSHLVKNDENLSHEKSEHHNNSMSKYKILDQFLKLYTGESKLTESINDNGGKSFTKTRTHNNKEVLKQPDQSEDIVVTRTNNNGVKVETIKNNVSKNNEPLSTIDDTIQTDSDILKMDKNKKVCDICSIPIFINNWSSHENGKKHKLNLKQMKMDDSSSVHYQMQKSGVIVNCRICSKEVPNDTLSIDTHLLSPEHILEYETLLKKNNIIQTENRIVCLVCLDYLDNKNEISHIGSPKHIKNIRCLRFSLGDLEKEKPNVFCCTICKTIISNKPAKLTKHLKSELHTLRRDIFFSANNIKSMSLYKDKYNILMCGWCDKEFHRSDLHEHISSESHRTHVQELVDYENKIIQHYMRDGKFKKLNCVICDDNESIYKNQRMIYWHIDSWHHKVKHRDLLSKNKIEQVDDQFRCNVCDISIEALQDVVHISTLAHQNNLLKFNKSDEKTAINHV